MPAVVIGVDPHKRSNTVLVLDSKERILATQRFANDRDGYRELKKLARAWRDRTWAIEGARGCGLGLAQRLACEGERVLDVPAKLAARVRALDDGGNGRKTDPDDAYAVAVAGLRAKGLRVVEPDGVVTVLKLLSDRRQHLVDQRITTVNRLHAQLQTLCPGGASTRLTARRARQMLSTVRPRDQVGKARKHLALELIGDLEQLDLRIKAAATQVEQVLAEHPSTVRDIYGFGALMTALVLGEVIDVRRFPSKHHFASYTGTAPVEASSGDYKRHRLNAGGNRRLNYALHVAAVAQIRYPTGPGRQYYDRKRAGGMSPLEAMRCLKRRLSDVLYRALLDDLARQQATGPGGHSGATLESSATGPTPTASSSDKSLPGPAATDATPTRQGAA